MDEMLFYTDPQELNDRQWEQVADQLDLRPSVTLTFIIDLPAIGEDDDDLRIARMYQTVESCLRMLTSRPISVEYGARTGGLMARVSFIVKG